MSSTNNEKRIIKTKGRVALTPQERQAKYRANPVNREKQKQRCKEYNRKQQIRKMLLANQKSWHDELQGFLQKEKQKENQKE